MQILLSEAIAKMREAIDKYDLSDRDLYQQNMFTHADCFAIQLTKGVTYVPCTFAIRLSEKYLEKFGDCKIDLQL